VIFSVSVVEFIRFFHGSLHLYLAPQSLTVTAAPVDDC